MVQQILRASYLPFTKEGVWIYQLPPPPYSSPVERGGGRLWRPRLQWNIIDNFFMHDCKWNINKYFCIKWQKGFLIIILATLSIILTLLSHKCKHVLLYFLKEEIWISLLFSEVAHWTKLISQWSVTLDEEESLSSTLFIFLIIPFDSRNLPISR